MNKPVRILVNHNELTLEGIKQFYVNPDKEDWKLENTMQPDHTVSATHGDIDQNTRVIKMSEFHSGSSRPENYLHRIGRSGWFGRKGKAINSVTKEDERMLQVLYGRGVQMKGSISLLGFLLPVLLFASVCLRDCNARDTVSITNPLHDSETIFSSGRTFKLGFFSPGNTTNRYVGIMFNVPTATVVWVANRDNPLNDSSGVLTISGDGNLVVLNGKKDILWSSNAPKPVANSSAQLLDDGNLVLTDNSTGTSVWESFQNPTNFFLRKMSIGEVANSSIRLTSWRSPSDPSIGNFSLGVNSLRIPEFYVWNRGVVYWRSGPWNGNIFIGVPAMTAIYRNQYDLVGNDDGTAYFTYDYINTTTLLHYELSSSGNLLEKELNDNGDWNISYSCVSSECDEYGKCGPNGRCDPLASPICSCLQGFEPRDEAEWNKGNWSGGCSRKAPLQCERNNSAGRQGEGDGYLKLTNVKIPDLSNSVATSEGNCSNDCLKDCFCSAYTFVVGIGCLHWNDSLIDIQQFSSNGADLYIRLASSELDRTESKQRKKAVIAATVSMASLFLAVSSFFLWNWLIKHRGRKQEAKLSLVQPREECKTEMVLNGSHVKAKLEELPLYGYETLANATESFHNKSKLGQGGFGPVYKGKLSNGPEIAVKRLSNSSSQGLQEFMNEVSVISKLQHRNLVRLLGCCIEREEKILVYEYMPNKSLDAYIFDSRKQHLLDWPRRCTIIEGIGRGLLYLHRDSRLRIIHRDMKASNILLDEDLNPKISDFGLARIFGGKQDQANTSRVVGTYGYMAPEYAMRGKFSEKSDVYSFGVLLLEIVSGRKNTSFYHEEENLISLLGYAWKLWNENQVVNLAFTEGLNPSAEMEILRCVHVGLLCVQESADDRPNMSAVLSMLNSEIRDLPPPKLPAYTARIMSHYEDQSCSPQQSERHSINDLSLTDVHGR
ncbi:OLC1v1025903C1 [Oldenlandia corymbosa var. corymbosa]|uniref:non-specific serine/threonine protein kinase n=1 Tax=Oldenlandia corymbosa var. corymbosa TaxID=529605 RepID=A0AAV1C784_OLDCO|nr:OLC1v1025903C1 [Oldenlandia corymbosa var. corymbosa]